MPGTRVFSSSDSTRVREFPPARAPRSVRRSDGNADLSVMGWPLRARPSRLTTAQIHYSRQQAQHAERSRVPRARSSQWFSRCQWDLARSHTQTWRQKIETYHSSVGCSGKLWKGYDLWAASVNSATSSFAKQQGSGVSISCWICLSWRIPVAAWSRAAYDLTMPVPSP
jgi:hypothetical protein